MSNEKLIEMKELLKKTLGQLGCPIVDEEETTVFFNYQDKRFAIELGGQFITIVYPNWGEVSVEDEDMMHLREAVNMANFHSGPEVLISAPGDDGKIRVHSKYPLFFHESLPALDEYLDVAFKLMLQTEKGVIYYFHEFKAGRKP